MRPPVGEEIHTQTETPAGKSRKSDEQIWGRQSEGIQEQPPCYRTGVGPPVTPDRRQVDGSPFVLYKAHLRRAGGVSVEEATALATATTTHRRQRATRSALLLPRSGHRSHRD